ncbi:MAG: hypothetical protein ACXU8U_09180, partial [Asticcacaulis sp.]
MPNNINRRAVFLGTAGMVALSAAGGAARAGDQAKLPPPPTPEMWARSPALYHVCISPEGTHIAYIHDDKGDKFMTV